MARLTCPKCGTPTVFPVQKFCMSCGAELPAGPATPGPDGARAAGNRVWPAAVAGIIILVVAALVFVPQVSPVHFFFPSANPADGGQAQPVITSSSPPTLTLKETVPVNTLPPTITSAAATPVTTPVPATTTQTPVPTPSTTVPAAVPTAEPTSVITLAETQVPQQPPVSSYTSSNPAAPFVDPAALEARVHTLINEKRQQNGLSSLSYDPFLADIARGHSWDMAGRNYFEHESPEGLTPRDRGNIAGYPCIRVIGRYTYEGIAENLYQGYRASSYYSDAGGNITSYNWRSLEDIAQVTVNGWMDSPGHRKNILDDHVILEGIGVSFSADDKVYITENLC